MKAKISNTLIRMAVTALTAGIATGAVPGITALAQQTKDVAVPSSGQTTQEVVGYFNVTSEDLNHMGYELVVTVPVSFDLQFDKGDKAYVGSGKVSASGVLDSDKAVSVTIDTDHEKYGKIFESDSTKDVTSKNTSGFKSDLSLEQWTSSMCYSNMQDKMNSSALSWTSNLSVTVPFKAFTLKELGMYYTTVPLVIKTVSAA